MHRVLLLSGFLFCPAVLAPFSASGQAAPSEPPTTAVAGPRMVYRLDGTWQCATDPDDGGEKEQWFLGATALPKMPRPGYAVTADGTIRAPGCWDAQGYGVETDKMRHNFDGKVWYRKEVVVPREWAGRRVFLCIGGVMRQARTWVNGRLAGRQIGYYSACEYDVTEHVQPGQTAMIAIEVDSRWRVDEDPLMGCGVFIDYMGSGYGQHAGFGSSSEATLGGIWGHVSLEARGDAYLQNLHVRPRIAPPSCIVSAGLAGDARAADTVRLDIRDADQRLAARRIFSLQEALRGSSITLTANQVGSIPEARLWSPKHPYLYTAELTLQKGEKDIDQVRTRFGLREIRIEGEHFLLNGKRILLVGYGDDSIFPETLLWPTDKGYYLERLSLAKALGFNAVRHHSSMLPEEYYDACDEMGLLIQAEGPLAYGNRAGNETGVEVYLQEWRNGILRHRNHPSILSWCVGNEGSGGEIAHRFHEIAKGLDPDRIFIDFDGIQSGGWIDGLHATMEYLTPQFNVFDSLLDFPDQYNLPKAPAKPVVSHEMGNYVTFPRFDQIKFYDGALKPFWLTWGRAKYERMGLLDQTNLWAEMSERQYVELHKLNIEALRKSPHMAGYHWWLLQDFWSTHNGIVENYFRIKSVPPQEVLAFNNDIVLLEQSMARNYQTGDSLETRLMVSNYNEEELTSETLVWRVRVGEQCLQWAETPAPFVAQGAVRELAPVRFVLPEVAEPATVRLEAELSAGKRRIFNSWTARLFPAQSQNKLPAPVYAQSRELESLAAWGAQPIPSSPPAGRAVYVTSRPTEAVIEAVKQGAALVALNGSMIFESKPSRYKLPWWRAGGDAQHSGAAVRPHPITRGMAPDGWCDKGWYDLLEGAAGVYLDKMPERPDVIIQGIETVEGGRDKAFLFEARVGQGVVVVSGLNHRRAAGQIENQWLIGRMIEYAAGGPQPKAEIAAEMLLARQTKIDLPQGGYYSGFEKVVSQDHERNAWHTLLEDNVELHTCRQSAAGNFLEWETVAAPDSGATQTTFVFAGGLGYESQPRTDGFEFLVNGKEQLRFDLASRKTTWESADGKVSLTFHPVRNLNEDYMGFFVAVVPREMVRANEPVRFGVKSLGSGSRRWFSLAPYKSIE